jgi:hypothetical protein
VQVNLGQSYAAWFAALQPPINEAHLPEWSAKLARRLAALPDSPVALEACWDGDTSGWFVVLCAITARPSSSHPRYSSTDLMVIQPRIRDRDHFNEKGSLRPDAWLASEIGGALARERGIAFYFAGPDRPDDEQPRWWDMADG